MKSWGCVWFEVLPVLLTLPIAAHMNSKRRGTLTVTTCVSTWFGRADPASKRGSPFEPTPSRAWSRPIARGGAARFRTAAQQNLLLFRHPHRTVKANFAACQSGGIRTQGERSGHLNLLPVSVNLLFTSNEAISIQRRVSLANRQSGLRGDGCRPSRWRSRGRVRTWVVESN
jgi:hypothetical protein